MAAEDHGMVQVREFNFVHDAPQAAELLRAVTQATAWSETDLLLLRDLSGAAAFVSVQAERVTGVVIGRKVGDEAEILNLAVREENRRQGAGRRLMERLLGNYQRDAVSRVFLEVRESNAEAIAFYQGLGFQAVGRRKGYYLQPREDASVMELRLRKSTESPG